MLKSSLLCASLLTALIAAPAFAQTSSNISPSTNAADQQQIEDGLQSGQLSTGEARSLERNQKRLDNAEAAGASQDQLNKMQDHYENKANTLENNAVTGNPNNPRNKMMQHDVQRNINQQNRIQNGIDNGTMTQGEAARAEHNQAVNSRMEANGHLRAANKRERHTSRGIHHKKHNANNAAPTDSSSSQ